MSKSSLKLLAICGIIAPIWFAIMVAVLGSVYPRYGHVTQHMSELGGVRSPVAWIFNPLGFWVYGILIIAFAYGLSRGVASAKIGSVLLAIGGAGMIMARIFPGELGTQSFAERMHMLAFMIIAFSSIFFSVRW